MPRGAQNFFVFVIFLISFAKRTRTYSWELHCSYAMSLWLCTVLMTEHCSYDSALPLWQCTVALTLHCPYESALSLWLCAALMTLHCSYDSALSLYMPLHCFYMTLHCPSAVHSPLWFCTVLINLHCPFDSTLSLWLCAVPMTLHCRYPRCVGHLFIHLYTSSWKIFRLHSNKLFLCKIDLMLWALMIDPFIMRMRKNCTVVSLWQYSVTLVTLEM